MVSWTADGTMAGYDPVTKKLKKGLYHFATPGTVDLKAITRLNYQMEAGLSTTTYPNGLQAVAPLTFTGSDFGANPSRRLSVGMIIARADVFPADHVPTPSEIFNLDPSKMDYCQRGSMYAFGTSTSSPVSITAELAALNLPYFWNTKWWVLLYPSAVINTSALWSKTNDAPIKGSNINTVGRALSFYSNRTPGKPTITSPVSGSIALPGSEFTIVMNPGDPDEVPPEDNPKFNDDVAGVEFQYRPAPTSTNTNPPWEPLPFDVSFYYDGETIVYRSEAWQIRGSRYWNGLAGTPAHHALVEYLGCPVIAGAGDRHSDYKPGWGALPTGDWQIRGRHFDYGHPYPNAGGDPLMPGPLGVNQAVPPYLLEPLNEYYPTQNTSPWSDPVSISIPTQVPPPVPRSPKDSNAVSGNLDTVRLMWDYRNTHQPPRAQYMRTVQIRKVGDLAWHSVFDGVGSANYVDLPTHLTQVSVPPLQSLPDGDFEAGTSSQWKNGGGFDNAFITNINDPARAYEGDRFLSATNTVGEVRNSEFNSDFSLLRDPILGIPEQYTELTVDGVVWIDSAVPFTASLTMAWTDSEGNYILDIFAEEPYNTPYVVYFTSKWISAPAGWFRFSEMEPDYEGEALPYGNQGADVGRRTIKRPPNAVGLIVLVDVHTDTIANPVKLTELRLDDMELIASATLLENFDLDATNQYEWRAKVVDTDGVESGYSSPAPFWMVPGPDTGEVRPVPTSTVDGATLGCGKHRVEVYRRGGKVSVGELGSLSHVDWSRVRDDISTAQVVVSGWDLDCGNLLAKLQTWAYEIVIWRDNGFSVDRVWEGPITLLTYENDKVTIDAKDVMGYAYRRIIKQKMTDSGTGNGTTVVDRARRVLQNTLAPDDPNVLAYLQPITRDDDAMQYRSTPAYSRTAFEEVDDMAANAGLDYTVIGRSILLWGTKHRIGTLPEFRDKDLGASPIVSEYGMGMANLYSVSDGNGVHGEASRLVSGNDPIYGLVEMLSSTWASDSEDAAGTYTQEGLETVTQSFKDFAERSIADRYPPPVVVRVPDNTSLNPDTVISIQNLVPGVVVPLRSTTTLRTVVASQKLDSVKVVEEGGKETVSITLSPFSRDDAAVTEGEE